MKLLLDTHLLLWAAGQPERLSAKAKKRLSDPANELLFSAASLWEIAIENTLGREDFHVDPRILRRGLLDNGYLELPVTGVGDAVGIGRPPAASQGPVRSSAPLAGSRRGSHPAHSGRRVGEVRRPGAKSLTRRP